MSEWFEGLSYSISGYSFEEGIGSALVSFDMRSDDLYILSGQEWRFCNGKTSYQNVVFQPDWSSQEFHKIA